MDRQLLQPSGCAIKPPFGDFYADESITSWHRRQTGLIWPRLDEEALRVLTGRDCGDLDFSFNATNNRIPPHLLEAFRQASRMPALLVLPFHLRSQYCLWCHRDDLARGGQPYMRRAWAVTWITACVRHGQLWDFYDYNQPDPWEVFFKNPTFKKCVLRRLGRPRDLPRQYEFDIEDDQRAIALERALSIGPTGDSAWWPGTMSRPALFDLYTDIVQELVSQYLILPHEGKYSALLMTDGPMGPFDALDTCTQFALNVISEAIISVWSRTPLAEPVSYARTWSIARWAGWLADPGETILKPPLGSYELRWQPSHIIAIAQRHDLALGG